MCRLYGLVLFCFTAWIFYRELLESFFESYLFFITFIEDLSILITLCQFLEQITQINTYSQNKTPLFINQILKCVLCLTVSGF